MPKRPRIAVIGAGNIACNYHLPSQQQLQKLGKSILAAICDLDSERAAKAAKKFDAKAVYSDIDTMLREVKPDGIVVLTPLKVTERVASPLLRKGYRLLIEKPPGASSKECIQLIKSARAGRAPHMVAFNRRFCPVIVQARAETLKRGPLKGASGRMYRFRRVENEFAFGTGIHCIDAVRFLGGDIESVETDARKLKGDLQRAYTLSLGFRNGGSGIIQLRPEAGASLERYEIYGNNTVGCINAGVGWLLDTPGNCQVYDQNTPVKMSDPLKQYRKFKAAWSAAAGGFYGENAHFVDCLRGAAKFGPLLEDSLESVLIAEAVQAGKSWRRRS